MRRCLHSLFPQVLAHHEITEAQGNANDGDDEQKDPKIFEPCCVEVHEALHVTMNLLHEFSPFCGVHNRRDHRRHWLVGIEFRAWVGKLREQTGTETRMISFTEIHGDISPAGLNHDDSLALRHGMEVALVAHRR